MSNIIRMVVSDVIRGISVARDVRGWAYAYSEKKLENFGYSVSLVGNDWFKPYPRLRHHEIHVDLPLF